MGGTEFVGRAVADDALARGWEVAVFHRGQHQAPVGALDLCGDRTDSHGLAALADGEWDIVLDTWTGAPTAVRDAVDGVGGEGVDTEQVPVLLDLALYREKFRRRLPESLDELSGPAQGILEPPLHMSGRG
ncbi:hypothetical protein GCM10009730_55180 [Streptomyces albidochromogenes]